MKINNFILNTEYGSLKNDSVNSTISVTLNAGTVFTPSAPNTVIAATNITIGTINSPIMARGNTTKYPSRWGVGNIMFADSLVSANGYPGTVTNPIWCILYRLNATTLRLLVTSEVVGGVTYTLQETQTITFKFRTFLSPLN